MGGLIVIEGTDGSGKSTQLDLLCRRLEEAGVDFRRLSFPNYDSPSGELVKMYLSGEFGQSVADVGAYPASVLYAVDRFAGFAKDWKRDYEAGRLLVSGRYVTSNAVHQTAKLPKSAWDEYLNWLADFEYRKLGLPAPDAVIYLDMPEEIADRLLMRRYEGNGERKDIHERDREYQRACRRAGAYAAEKLGWHVVRAARGGEPKPPEVIGDEIWALVRPYMQPNGKG